MNSNNRTFISNLTSTISAIVFIFYSIWFIKNESTQLLPTIFSFIVVLLTCSLINNISTPLEDFWFLNHSIKYSKQFFPTEVNRKNYYYICGGIALWCLILNVLLFFVIHSQYPFESLSIGLEKFFGLYLDTVKYQEISNSGYTKELLATGSYKNILPLYVLLLNLFSFAGNGLLLAMLFNSLLCMGSGVLLFHIQLIDGDEKISIQSVIFLFLLPSTFFLLLPLPDSLFLALSLAYVYLIRRRAWLYAFFVGYAIGFTSSNGIPLTIFALVEYIAYIREELYERKEFTMVNLDQSALYYIHNNDTLRKDLLLYGKLIFVLSIPIAYFIFWILCQFIYDDPLSIVLFYNNIIKNNISYFFSNAFQLVKYVTETNIHDLKIIFGSYIPSIVAMIVPLIIVYRNITKIRISYVIYFISFYILVYGQQNFLSGARVLLSLFPIPMLLTAITPLPMIKWGTVVLLLIVFIIYFNIFLQGYPVF